MKVFIRRNALSFFDVFCKFILVSKRCKKETQINSIDDWRQIGSSNVKLFFYFMLLFCDREDCDLRI